jgi:peptide subunit release factor 1 (eRF1)
MITKLDIKGLLERKAVPGSPALSVYLDTDQADAANLNRMFEVALSNALREVEETLDSPQRKDFEGDAIRVLEFIEGYRPHAKGLVIFCDSSEGFFRVHELQVPVKTKVQWSEKPYLRPLLEIIDENERYGVILTDRSQARLFSIFLGEIEEYREAFSVADVTRIKGSERDHIRSQTRHQHRADTHALWHLKQVAESMEGVAERFAFDRLALAGQVEATTEVYRHLSKGLRAKVIGTLALAMDSSERQILAETLKLMKTAERTGEIEIVEHLIEAAEKQEQATIGLEQTIAAVQAGRVRQLVYAEGWVASGSRCSNCSSLMVNGDPICGYCGAPLHVVDDLLGRTARRVAAMGGVVEQVRGDAATRLQEAGGIGAFLR